MYSCGIINTFFARPPSKKSIIFPACFFRGWGHHSYYDKLGECIWLVVTDLWRCVLFAMTDAREGTTAGLALECVSLLLCEC